MSRFLFLLTVILAVAILIPLAWSACLFAKKCWDHGFSKAVKKTKSPDYPAVVNVLTSLIVLLMAYLANKEGAGLVHENQRFLETAKTINVQAQEFQEESLKAFQILNAQTKEILEGAGETNRRSIAFLETSKGTLESFRQSASDLQRALQANIALADRQIQILTKTLEREEELLNRQPILAMRIGTVGLTDKPTERPIPIVASRYPEWTTLEFLVTNTGPVSLRNPIIMYEASPDSLDIGYRRIDGIIHRGTPANTYQLSGQGMIAINPGNPFSIPIEVQLPESISKFSVKVTMLGDDLRTPLKAHASFVVSHLDPGPPSAK